MDVDVDVDVTDRCCYTGAYVHLGQNKANTGLQHHRSCALGKEGTSKTVIHSIAFSFIIIYTLVTMCLARLPRQE